MLQFIRLLILSGRPCQPSTNPRSPRCYHGAGIDSQLDYISHTEANRLYVPALTPAACGRTSFNHLYLN